MLTRVLVIINTIDAGGAETFVMKVFRALDKEKYVFDFLINKNDSVFYKQEIESYGGKIYYGYSKSRNPVKSFFRIKRVVKEGKYNTVFCVAVHPLAFVDLLASRLGGASVLLTRSTNSNAGGIISNLLAAISRPFVRSLSTQMFAPSPEAAIWLFGEKMVKERKVHYINNGIAIENFIFSDKYRRDIRTELGISDSTFVVGHIGRFNRQKNHEKIINIYNDINSMMDDSVMLLVGEGEKLSDIEDYVDKLNLKSSVKFLGIRADIPSLLMAFDVMVFPSLYEGMPNVIIEAQATDLPCLVSDTITPKVKITEDVVFYSLDTSDAMWAKKVCEMKKDKRVDRTKEMINNGYSINSVAQELSTFFK